MKTLAESMRDLPHERLIAVISMSSDKNIPQMIANLVPVVDTFVVTSHTVMGRAAERGRIGAEIVKHGKHWESVEKVGDAVERALTLSVEKDLVLVTGSVFAVGEARRRWVSPDRSA